MLIVVLFHLDLPWMKGGYLGVDIFFVLSGFLITTLLVQEWTTHGRIDLKQFWIRRARRLLPAMLLVLFAVAGFAVLFAESEQLDDIRSQGLASLFYVTNWARAFDTTSYFDQFAAKSPLEHYWSLAIEEQFYLVWPVITVALFSWRSRASGALTRGQRYDVPLWLVGAVGAAASAGLMALLYTPDNFSLYFRTDTRVQGLLIGVALAALYDGLGKRLLSSPPKWLVPVGWGAAAVFLVAAMADVPPALLYQGGFLVIAVLSATVIVAAMAGQRSSLDRALSLRPFRFFGRISYGLYLWHWPIILALTPQRTGLSLPALNVLRFGLSVGAAMLSLLLIEVPIRERRMPVRLELVGIAVTPVLIAIALIAGTTGAEQTLEEAYASDQEAAAPPVEAVKSVEPPAQLSTLVLGDELARSLPADWGDADGDGPGQQEVTLAGSGCDDAATLCEGWRDRWEALVRQNDPDVVVVGVRNWEPFDDTNTPIDVFDSAKNERAYTESMERLVRQLGAGPTAEGGRTVVLLTAPPINDPTSFDAFAVERSREAAQQVATRSGGDVEHVQLGSLWCGQVQCVDTARLNPAEGEFNLISPNPEAFGGALAGVARRSVRRHLTQEAMGDQLRVLLFGDSVAWSIGSNFFGATDARSTPFLLWNKAEFSCFPDPAPGRRQGLPGTVTTECPDWAQRWPTYVEEFAPDIVLVPVSQWMILDREVDGRNIPFDSDEMRQRIEKYYGQMIDALSQDGSLVVLTTVIPNVESTNAASIEKNLDDTRRREVALNEIIAELVASRSEDAELIDLAGWICDGTDCTEEIDGVRLRPDGGHFTPDSSPLAGAFLSEELQRIAKERGLGPEAPTVNPEAAADEAAADADN